MDGVAPVDAQNASTSRLENPHSTRVSHTAHAHHLSGRKQKIKDHDLRRTRLDMRPGISYSLTGRLREDLSEGLRNYLRANTRLLECAEAVLGVEGRSAAEIFGSPDDLKLQSCATLFACVVPTGSVFERLLDKYYRSERDPRTIQSPGMDPAVLPQP